MVAYGQLFDDATLEHALRAETLADGRRGRLGVADDVDFFLEAREPQIERGLRGFFRFDANRRAGFDKTVERSGDVVGARRQRRHLHEALAVGYFGQDGVVVERRDTDGCSWKDDR